MKKNFWNFILLLFILIPHLSNGQHQSAFRESFWFHKNISQENSHKNTTKKNSIRQKTIITKQTSGRSNSAYMYDKEGRVIAYKSNKKFEIRIAYSKDNLFQVIKIYNHNKLVERDSFNWNNRGNLKECFYFDGSDKLFAQETNTYNDSLILEYVYKKLKNGKLSERRKQVFEYYPDNSRKKITYYKKGKPDYYTVFDCNPLGENHTVKKDSSYNCVRQDIDSLGNKIRITIVNEKTIPRKKVEYFNKKNECIAQKTYDLKSNDPLWFYFFNPGITNFTEFISYKNKKEFYRIKNIYNENDQCIESSTYRHGRLKHRSTIVFNSKGIPEKQERYNKRNKLEAETTISYEYY